MVVVRRLVLLLLVSLAWAPAAYAWSWPVRGPVLQPFAYDEAHPYAAGQHRGIDIGADAAGESVVAPATGAVSFAGSVPASGLSVTLETPDGYSVTLTHLGSILVAKGAAVAEGDDVGTVGPSGTPEVDGPYVHLGIRLTVDPNGYLDPLTLLPAVETPTAPGSSGNPAPPVASVPAGSTTPATVPAPTPAPAPSSAPGTVEGSPVAATATAPARTDRARPVAAHGAPAPGRSASTVSRDEVAELDETGSAGAGAGEDGGKRSRTAAAGRPSLGAAATNLLTEHTVASRPARSQQPPHRHPLSQPGPALLSLALSIGPGLVAAAAALAALLGRARRRRLESAVAGGSVVQLPLRSTEPREAVRAA